MTRHHAERLTLSSLLASAVTISALAGSCADNRRKFLETRDHGVLVSDSLKATRETLVVERGLRREVQAALKKCAKRRRIALSSQMIGPPEPQHRGTLLSSLRGAAVKVGHWLMWPFGG